MAQLANSSAKQKPGLTEFGTRRRSKGIERNSPAAGKGTVKVLDRLGNDITKKVMNFPEAKAEVQRISNVLARRELEQTNIEGKIQDETANIPTAMSYMTANPMKVHERKQKCEQNIKTLQGRLRVVKAEIKSTKRELAGAKNTLEEAEIMEDARSRLAKRREEEASIRSEIMAEGLYQDSRGPVSEAPIPSADDGVVARMSERMQRRIRNHIDRELDLGEEEMRFSVRHTPESGGPSWSATPSLG